MPYGPYWREHRKTMNHFLNEQASTRYHDKLANTNAVFLRSLLESPHRFREHIHRSVRVTRRDISVLTLAQ